MTHPNRRKLVVTYAPGEEGRRILEEDLSGLADVAYLKDAAQEERVPCLSSAEALLCWMPARELASEEFESLGGVRLMQLFSAGADQVPHDRLPSSLTLASNAGAYAGPMAEHVLALTLALLKRLPAEHAKLRRGEFDQNSPNRALRGATCGILGFGGIGRATARLMRAFGAKVYAINTSGKSPEEVEFVGTPDDLDYVLRSSDVLVVCLPLNESTRNLLGERELGRMKPDAVLVNVARGEIVDQKALYERLRSHPRFTAGLDAWWVEPLRHGRFQLDYPFLDLPNVLGSPHNSAMVPGAMSKALERAAENLRRHFAGEPISGVVRQGNQS